MKFNQLKKALRQYEKNTTPAQCAPSPQVSRKGEKQSPHGIRDGTGEKVVGGVILRKPINRTAALVVAKAPWWAKLIITKEKVEPEPKRKRNKKRMKGNYQGPTGGPITDFTTKDGIRIKMVNGEEHMSWEDVKRVMMKQIEELPAETNPHVKAAKDARRIMDELLNGIGGDMERFRANTKTYLEDIRQTRFAMVTETAQMTKELKEVRQFFLGGDYKEEIARLKEFVDLCERLHDLKESGFLDKVADTMLTLS